MADSCDIAILGGGPAGCCLALALHGGAHELAVLERRPAGADAALAGRPIALSHASRLILDRIGVWRDLVPTPIETILVSREGFGRTRLDAADCGVPALGYVIEYSALARAVEARTLAAGIRVKYGASDLIVERGGACMQVRGGGGSIGIATRCVVHAEGSGGAEEKNYHHDALVAMVGVEPPARTTAYERFTAPGPLALLPMAGRHALVWSMPPERAAALAQAEPALFLRALQDALGGRAGRMVAVENRGRVPLNLRMRSSHIADREAFIGNAAQTLHPVAGQGLNLGLRDAWDLATVLRESTDPGAPAALRRFAAARRLDSLATIRVTDLLAGAFPAGNPVGGAAHGVLMTALDVVSPARRFFARRMMFGPSAIP